MSKLNANQHKQTKKQNVHVNSRNVEFLCQRIRELNKRLTQLGIVPTEPPDVELNPKVPMLGHTKGFVILLHSTEYLFFLPFALGNTASNRKKIKAHQITQLTLIVNHLEKQLSVAIGKEEDDNYDDDEKNDDDCFDDSSSNDEQER